MVRFCFWCVLVFSLLLNNAAAQNPFSVFDVFNGSEKKSDASDEATSANLDENAETPEVERVESIEQSGEDAPPFPQAKQAEKPQPENPQPELKTSRKAGTSEKPADSKHATKAATEEVEELPQPEPQSVLKSVLKPAPKSTPKTSSEPVQPASATVPDNNALENNVQPAAHATSGEAYLGASIKKRQQGRMGVEVTTVAPNSPAEAAGIRTGDVLITFAGSPITSTGEFQELIELLVPGDRVELELMRGAKKEEKLVTLADSSKSVAENSIKTAPVPQTDSNVAPASDLSATQPARNLVVPADQRLMNQPELTNGRTASGQATVQRAQLGVVVVDGVEETRSGLRREVRTGAAVETVKANSPAARSNIPVGALIVAANGRRIETANDLVQYIDTLRPGQAVELIFYADSRPFKVSVTLAGSNGLVTSGQSVLPDARQQQGREQSKQQNVRQAADFQPVPGNTGLESVQEVQRPILKRFGERMPLLRRVDNMIERFEQPAVQGGVITETPTQVAPQTQSQNRHLEQTIRQQQEQIEGLNRRLRELEARRRR